VTNENNNFKREITNLQENINHLKAESNDMGKENELVKENAFSLEKQNMYLRNSVETNEQRITEISKELDRTKSLLNAQRDLKRTNERHESCPREFKERTVSAEQDNKENSDHSFNQMPARDDFQSKSISNLPSSQTMGHEYNRRNKSSINNFQDFMNMENEERHMPNQEMNQAKSFSQLPASNEPNPEKQGTSTQKLEFMHRQLQELTEKNKMLEADY